MEQNTGLELLSFSGVVSATGYRWERARVIGKPAPESIEIGGEPQLFLVPATSCSEFGRGDPKMLERCWEISSQPALFRNFAEVALAPAAIEEFATTFGSLGDTYDAIVTFTDNDDSFACGASFDTWTTEIARMRTALRVSDIAEHGSVADFLGIIRWREISAGVEMFQLLNPPKPGDTVSPVPFRMAFSSRDEIRRLEIEPSKLRPFLRHIVATLIDRKLQNSFTMALGTSDDRSVFKFSLGPRGMLDALWLQFALALHGKLQFRRCLECSKWYPVAGGITKQSDREDKLRCGSACRSRAQRKKKAEAKELYSNGATIAEIAAKFDADPKNVEGWITGKLRRRKVKKKSKSRER